MTPQQIVALLDKAREGRGAELELRKYFDVSGAYLAVFKYKGPEGDASIEAQFAPIDAKIREIECAIKSLGFDEYVTEMLLRDLAALNPRNEIEHLKAIKKLAADAKRANADIKTPGEE